MNVPASLKALSCYIKRAEELDRDTLNPDSKVVAYYCRQYAMEKGIKVADRSPDVNKFLMDLMAQLEAAKASIITTPQEERKVVCENFSYEVFTKADEEDRNGLATKATARSFYAAGSFFDILELFGDLSSDVCVLQIATVLTLNDVCFRCGTGTREASLCKI